VGGAAKLLIEFHHRFSGKGIGDTLVCIAALKKKGFKSFHITANQEEWSFLRHA
jgi:hypothetical protein